MACTAAARRQLDRICDSEAMRLAGAGLSLDPDGRTRAALLEVRGEARCRAGQLTAARADFTAALNSLDDPASRSRVLAQLAILDARTAGAARGGELAALAIAEAGDQPAALGQALAAAAIIDLTEGNRAAPGTGYAGRPGCWTRPATAAAAPGCCTGRRWRASSMAGCMRPPPGSTAWPTWQSHPARCSGCGARAPPAATSWPSSAGLPTA
ncbi:MAG TPA: hypothetical protein VFQ68_05840 [Streptosporangiaceae bacterium]|nr:hypothetical protein [Streptosporangiaceae bacterium]